MSRMTSRAQPRSPARPRADKPPAGRHVCLLHPLEGESDGASDPAPSRQRILPPPIGRKLREIRQKRRLTLSEVEAMSGISKSMLSQIERGRVNPTFARVWHLTRSLGIGVGELLGEVSSRFELIRQFEHQTVLRTPTITSADGLCTTRILNPMRFPLPVEWYEMTLEKGGSLRANAHGNGAWEHMTVVTGRVIVEIGEEEVRLEVGETVRYSAEQPHGVRNDFRGQTKLVLVLVATNELDGFDLGATPRG